ncbi:hypothetical protein LINPERHAP1_LOCUS6, partial [Linum perenne]
VGWLVGGGGWSVGFDLGRRRRRVQIEERGEGATWVTHTQFRRNRKIPTNLGWNHNSMLIRN